MSLMVVIMIIPTVHSDTESQGYKTPPSPNYSNFDDDRHLSYEEKLQKELDRLLVEYELKEPEDGGPYDEILIDFQQIRLNEIEDLEEILAVDLLPDEADEDIDTLGGLVFAMLGRVPRVGEVISHPVGINFEIVDADLRRVKRLLVRPGAPLAADGDGNGNGDDENSNPASDAGG